MGIYLGLFVLSFATLAFEVTLTRLLSVTTWYHLAFFAVSTALLGMTAGATTVYLRPAAFRSQTLRGSVSKACLAFSLATPLALVVLCLTPVDIEQGAMGFYALLVVTLACMLPFYFVGIAITAILTKSGLPIGRLYASDLVGASLGCLFVLGGLELFDAPSLVLLCGCLGILAAVSFGRRSSFRSLPIPSAILLGTLAVLVLLNGFTDYGIRPLVVKGRVMAPEKYVYEKWNSFSRVAVYQEAFRGPQYWGESPSAPKDKKVYQYKMNIDGQAATTVMRFDDPGDIDHLRYDVTNIAYPLRPGGEAFIIGVGGGRDVQSAILFGQSRIVGIDVNPIFIDLLEGRFRAYAGIADRPEVTLVADEARSYLARTPDKYTIIQMSLIDTWAATGAGAFALSENALYTVQAWKTFLAHLHEDGIFTVSRWFSPRDLGETGRILSLAVAALLEAGVDKPGDHLAMVTIRHISTLLVSRSPLTDEDITSLRQLCNDLQFKPVVLPGTMPDNDILARIVSAGSWEDLRSATEGAMLNYRPPTDDNPYFFNMLRLSKGGNPFASGPAPGEEAGVIGGNLTATRTLTRLIMALMVVAVVAVVFPLVFKAGADSAPPGGKAILWSGAAYFSLIGAGFMFVEIALIQRLSVFLGHPMYALGVLLFTIIASAGAGSFASDRLPLVRRPWVFVYPVIIALGVVAVRFALPAVASRLVAAPMMIKIPAAVITIVPVGLLLGIGFPTGMRLVRAAREHETPWYWALNGIFGVLCSALTVFVSIYLGISTSLYLGATCYLLVSLCIPGMLRAAENPA
jgi:hypothetical protein